MSLSIRALSKQLKAGSTTPGSITHFSGNALNLTLVLPTGETFDGAEKVWLEIHTSRTSDPDDVLTDFEVLAPTGGSVLVPLTSAHMNVGFDGPIGQFWIVVFVTWAGENPERTEVIWTANLLLQRHNASMTSPAPPAPVLRLTQTNADARYALLTSLATLAGRVTALEGAGATGAVRYDAVQTLSGGQQTQARANIGAVIGTDVQAYSAKLAAIAALTWAADKLIYLTGTGTVASTTLTAAARTLLAAASEENLRIALGLPTNTLAMQTAQSLIMEGGDSEASLVSLTGAGFTETQAETDMVRLNQAMDNTDNPCHAFTMAVTSSSSPISGSSIFRFLSQDVEQFALNFDGSPRIYSLRRAAWRTQLGLGPFAIVADLSEPGTIGNGAQSPAYFSTVTLGTSGVRGDITAPSTASIGMRVTVYNGLEWWNSQYGYQMAVLDGSSLRLNVNFQADKVGANATGLVVKSTSLIGFTSLGNNLAAGPEVAFGKSDSETMEVNNGTAGTFRDFLVRKVRQVPGTSVTPATNGELVFEATSNTSVTVKLKGTDGTVRTAVLTLS